MFNPLKIKFNEYVWHDRSYSHPQLGTTVQRDFFDRTDSKKQLETILRTGTQKLAVISGERRAGKTSLLRCFTNNLKTDPGGQFVTVLLPGVHSRHELVREILQGIAFELDAELPSTGSFDTFQQGPMTTSKFLDNLRRLLDSNPGKMTTLCIDEFDSMVIDAPVSERGSILALINALVESSDLPIKLLLTIVRVPQIPEAHASPLFTKSTPIPLPPFSKADLDEMVTELLVDEAKDLSAPDLNRLYQLSGGWPYFAKLLLVHMSDLSPGDTWLDQAVVKAIKDRSGEVAIKHIYTHHFDDQEKMIALLLAQQEGKIKAEEVSFLDISLQTAAKELVNRHFVIIDNSGNYLFRIGFLTHWFRSWARFEEEVENRLQNTLQQLERRYRRRNDPWADSEPKRITVTAKDLGEHGLEI